MSYCTQIWVCIRKGGGAYCMLDFVPTYQLVSLINDLVHFLRFALIKLRTEIKKLFMITILQLKKYIDLFHIRCWTNKHWPCSLSSMYLSSLNCLPNWDTSTALISDFSMHFQRMRLVRKGVTWRLEIDRFRVAVSCRHIFPYFHPPISLECLNYPLTQDDVNDQLLVPTWRSSWETTAGKISTLL